MQSLITRMITPNSMPMMVMVRTPNRPASAEVMFVMLRGGSEVYHSSCGFQVPRTTSAAHRFRFPAKNGQIESGRTALEQVAVSAVMSREYQLKQLAE